MRYIYFFIVFLTATLMQYTLLVSSGSAADNLICDDYRDVVDLGPLYENPDLQGLSISAYEFARSGKFDEAVERAQLTMDLYDSGCGGDSRELYNPLEKELPHAELQKFQAFASCSSGNYEAMVELYRKAWGQSDTHEIGSFINALYEIGVISDDIAVTRSLSSESLDQFLAKTDLSMLDAEEVCHFIYPSY